MDDNKSKSPWDELADDLGAEPTADSFERKQPPATDIPTVASEAATDLPEPQKTSPSDWDALAGALGLEIEDEPVAEVDEPNEVALEKPTARPPAVKVEKPKADGFADGIAHDPDTIDSMPPLPSEVDRVMSDPEWSDDVDSQVEEDSEANSDSISEEARNAFDALFTASGSAWASPASEAKPEEGLSRSLELDAVIPGENTGEKSEEEDEEQSPRRRRPRRRRRGRGGRKPSEEKAASSDDKTATDEEETLSDCVDAPQDEEEKPRRRRPRRRSRRSSSSDAPATDEKKPSDEASDSGTDDDDDLDNDGAGSKDASKSRSTHRNLPTWADAIGGIVDSNLALRSKSPSKPNSSQGRSRGGRRRGGSKKKT